MSGLKSRNKGKRMELQAAHACESCLNVVARRTAQRRGTATADIEFERADAPGDVLPIHVECKGHARIGAIRFLEQAERDKKEHETACVVMRQDNDTDWVFMCRLKDFKGLADDIFSQDTKHYSSDQ